MITREQLDSEIRALFSEARTGGIEYLYTLVRVEGITHQRDPLEELRRLIDLSIDLRDPTAVTSLYCDLIKSDEPLSLLSNLLNCSQGKPYEVWPLPLPGSKPHDSGQKDKALEVSARAKVAAKTVLSTAIEDAYSHTLECASPRRVDPATMLHALDRVRLLLVSLLSAYASELQSYRGEPTIYRLPGFEVLELLVDQNVGLNGFRIHFSNDSTATFVRKPDGTESVNILLGPPVNFMAGDLGALRPEWRIRGARLYEVGISGRYNNLGEWKPIVYPGKPDMLEADARKASPDDDVQGALFYMMCTGYRLIEFVVRATIELPQESVTFGTKFHLWRCPPPNWDPHASVNYVLYDGTLELDAVDPGSVRAAIDSIGIGVNRMGFAYGGTVDWCVKYRTHVQNGGYATPTEEDLGLLDSLLRRFPRTEDAMILEAALDWYNRGRATRNVFMAFLCYYVAIESVAVAISDGEASFGLLVPRKSREELLQERNECVENLRVQLYEKDRIDFVRRAYFECVGSITEKTRSVAEIVFGTGHPHLETLFSRKHGLSLADIRGKLAHGAVTLLAREDRVLVAKRIGDVEEIASEFLTRIIFLLKPGDVLPSWSRSFRMSGSLADPRVTLYVTDERMLPTKDWRIRPEWVD